MQAKFTCTSVSELKDNDGKKRWEDVYFSAVTSDDPANPNHSWAVSTPAGNAYLRIEREGAWGHFVAGKEYVLAFMAAD